MKTKVMVDFQICISVPLSIFRDEFSDNVMHCAELICDSTGWNEFSDNIKSCFKWTSWQDCLE